MYQLLLIANRKFRLIPWPVKTKGTLPLFHISHNLNHVSTYHVTFDRLSLGLRVYFSPLFLDPVSLLMAYQHQDPAKNML
jgi:hypothetical protein